MLKLTVQGNVECKLNGSLDFMVMVPMQMGVCVWGGVLGSPHFTKTKCSSNQASQLEVTTTMQTNRLWAC